MDIQQQKQKAAQAYKILSIVQYAAPILLVLVAFLLADQFGENAHMIIAAVCFVALMDFFLIRFMLLPRMKQKLDEMDLG